MINPDTIISVCYLVMAVASTVGLTAFIGYGVYHIVLSGMMAHRMYKAVMKEMQQ